MLAVALGHEPRERVGDLRGLGKDELAHVARQRVPPRQVLPREIVRVTNRRFQRALARNRLFQQGLQRILVGCELRLGLGNVHGKLMEGGGLGVPCAVGDGRQPTGTPLGLCEINLGLL